MPTREHIKELLDRLVAARTFLRADDLEKMAEELENRSSKPEFWNDPSTAQHVMSELASKKKILALLDDAQDALDEAKLALELSDEDLSFIDEATSNVCRASKIIESLEDEALFSGEFDKGSAIVTVNPGEGGLEAQDFARMLFDMYIAYAKSKEWKIEVIDYVPDELKGIERAVVQLDGTRVYGMLHGDNGVHRLVRVSPTDDKRRRHTSFASVEVMPILPDDVEVDLDERDIDMDVFRSSGPGGQGVNTTDSAVRLTHRPSGIVVTCQVERSQLRNRERAMQMLRSKLYERALAEKEAKASFIAGEKATSAWGHQIRSYVLYPFKQVQDLRTRKKFPNADAILAGDLNELIMHYKRWKAAQATQ